MKEVEVKSRKKYNKPKLIKIKVDHQVAITMGSVDPPPPGGDPSHGGGSPW